MNITAIYGSPRKDGNTDIFMNALVRGIREKGGSVNEVHLRNLTFSPCIECGGCDTTGKCVLKDDMLTVYPLLTRADIVVLAAPVFFYGLNALAKAMVDRCQCFWIRKYVLKKPLREAGTAKKRGVLLSTCGSKGKKSFDGLILSVRYFFDVLDMDFSHQIVCYNVDGKGEMLNHQTELDEAYNLGIALMEQKQNNS